MSPHIETWGNRQEFNPNVLFSPWEQLGRGGSQGRERQWGTQALREDER